MCCLFALGVDYPERMVCHEEVTQRNRQWMEAFSRYFEKCGTDESQTFLILRRKSQSE